MTFCPPAPIPAKPLSYDIAHEREFYKYFQPFRLGLAGLRPRTNHAAPREAFASPDRALTAFAQLATLRLNCQRSFISFFDRDFQYVVAEATRTLSLQTQSEHAPGDEINYGLCINPKHGSICEHALAAPFDLDRYTTDQAIFVVPDLNKDPRFSHREYTVDKGWAFYAGTPIISPNGYSIGAYCVIDDEPREGLSPSEVTFMKDMATTVMLHLDMLRAQAESIKGERMVRGLGSFVEGKSSLEDWWMRADMTPGIPTSPIPSWANTQYSNHHEHSDATSYFGKPSSLESLGVKLDIQESSSRRGSRVPSEEPLKPMTSTEDPKAKKTSAQHSIAPEAKAVFGRASNIIRECLEIDAVVIFDATAHSTFGGLIDQTSHERPKRRKVSSGSEDSYVSSSGTEQASMDGETSAHDDNPSEILGFATLNSSSTDTDQSARLTDGMKEKFLRSLLRRYPHGKILNFDEQGCLLEGDGTKPKPKHSDASTSTSSAKRKRKRLTPDEAQVIRKIFPNVRSLAVVPMWDSHQKFFSACVAWTVDPYRILTMSSELSYLAAFSDCAMSEVARINAKIADRAKSDFISSISHELRSPLHGIRGSSELLQMSSLDPFQENLVHTLETCGNTLLDTIDHLLDFAKINNFTRKGTQRQSTTSSSANRKQNLALDVEVDLSVVTEEVLESVFAGHDFLRAGRGIHEDVGDFSAPAPRNREVTICVDISKAKDCHWVFRTQAGGWRRVLMNLFGNALKYTSHGFIHIKLDCEPLPRKDQGGQFRVTLSVTDSGKGISQEFLKTKLYTPFSQQDSLAPGTGLGLAITSAIVKSMDGTIDVRSKEGQGTEVVVVFNMTHIPSDEAPAEPPVIAKAAEKTCGLKIGFIGFRKGSDTVPECGAGTSQDACSKLTESFENMCQSWFGMNTELYRDFDNLGADILVTNETRLEEVQEEYEKRKSNDRAIHTPLLVMCDSPATANSMLHDPKSHVSGVISQPCGPRKLAKALMFCLESTRNDEIPDEHTSSQITDAKQKEMIAETANQAPVWDVTLKRTREDILKTPQITSKPQRIDTTPLQNTSPSSARSIVESKDSSPITPNPNKPIRKVLLVDDNRINLHLLITYMKKAGHSFKTANNGLEALEIYKADSKPGNTTHMSDPPFDFVLMDVSMPIMDGLESTRRIRAHERDNRVRPATVIALTGLASSEAQQEAFGSGVNTFMTKPVKLRELSKVLEKAD